MRMMRLTQCVNDSVTVTSLSLLMGNAMGWVKASVRVSLSASVRVMVMVRVCARARVRVRFR